jgi:hypothetical protein
LIDHLVGDTEESVLDVRRRPDTLGQQPRRVVEGLASPLVDLFARRDRIV